MARTHRDLASRAARRRELVVGRGASMVGGGRRGEAAIARRPSASPGL